MYRFVLIMAMLFIPVHVDAANAETNYYVGIMPTYTQVPELCDDNATCSDSETSLSVLAGYQINDWLAAEGSLRYLGSNFEGGKDQFDLYGGDLAALFRVPFYKSDTLQLDPIIKVGALYTTEGNVDLIFGAGVSMILENTKEVRLMYEYADDVVKKGEIEIFSLSLIWRFR